MRAVKEGRFFARALHIVHLESARDWSKLRLVCMLPIRVPQHPWKNFSVVFWMKEMQKGKIHLKFPLFIGNLQTTRAFCALCKSSQTGNPPTRMLPSWGPDHPTSLTSEVSYHSQQNLKSWMRQHITWTVLLFYFVFLLQAIHSNTKMVNGLFVQSTLGTNSQTKKNEISEKFRGGEGGAFSA